MLGVGATETSIEYLYLEHDTCRHGIAEGRVPARGCVDGMDAVVKPPKDGFTASPARRCPTLSGLGTPRTRLRWAHQLAKRTTYTVEVIECYRTHQGTRVWR